ncbi:cytochrome P450 [Massariosphaeria phaeospora]|uniref:Cytochrome P450 n=1 Tax=Massariosphaeria phaeospora TaxID=100035 RepID=A0A7C8M9K3_9PLEO|nr:cytochrome P450 [Massariosphaeria phaeospora]
MSSLGLTTAVLLGISSHIFYFRIGENHMSGPWLAILVPLLWTSAVARRVGMMSLPAAVNTTTLELTAYGLRNHLVLEELHEKYGDIVRIGPNEIAVFRADGIPAIHGPGSKCTKASWYDLLQKDKSIHATRKPELHQARRRIWDQGFGPKALRNYQERVKSKVDLLAENIARSKDRAVNYTELFAFFGLDVMGDTAFGEGFGMLESNKPHPVMDILRLGVNILGRLSPVPWLITLLSSLPGATPDFTRLERFGAESVLKRAEMDRDESDIMSKLIAAARDPNDASKLNVHWVCGDALVMIVAGSVTVAATLTFLFCHLALLPQHAQTLRGELANIDIADNRVLQPLPYLNALINETLRLYPPVPTALLRQTPPEGIPFGDRRVPGGVTVSTPLWSLGRLESSYVRAKEFLPERWYAGSELVRDQRGFAPFLSGAYGVILSRRTSSKYTNSESGTHSCLGKQLALMELRLVAAKLVTAYEFGFAEGSGGAEVLDFKDSFTAVPGSLRLVFRARG